MNNEEYTADRLRMLLDDEFMFNLTRAIMFYKYEDKRNACRFIERCIGISYTAGALSLYNSREVYTMICILMNSKIHEAAYLCERCLNDDE